MEAQMKRLAIMLGMGVVGLAVGCDSAMDDPAVASTQGALVAAPTVAGPGGRPGGRPGSKGPPPRACHGRGPACVPKAPSVKLTPKRTTPQVAGTPVAFDLLIENQNTKGCEAEAFDFFFSPGPSPLTADPFFGAVSLAPGEKAHVTVSVKSLRSAVVGTYAFQYVVADEETGQTSAAAEAKYLVGTGPVACDGTPPLTPMITGSPESPTAFSTPFTFAATGLTPPVVTTVTSPDGVTQSLHVEANPGISADLAQNFAGFGLGFGFPGCVDASAFTGVKFTITGDLGTCALTFNVVPSEDNSVAFGPLGTCTATQCFGPMSAPLTTGTTVVRFADMSGGMPLATVDATALNDLGWTLTVPTDGTTAPCVASFTVGDVSFVP